MRERQLIALLIVCAVVAAGLLISTRPISAQNDQGQQPPPPPFYNPYPAGILPPDLPQEIERVRGEVRFIENEAIAEWRSLGPLTFTGQPPTIQGNGYQAVRVLGKLLNFDENMSVFKNEACSFCHMPYAGFSGPIPSVNLTMIAYPASELPSDTRIHQIFLC